MKLKTIFPVLMLMTLMLAGCKTQKVNQPLAPGAYNQIDQDIYVALRTTQGSLSSLKASLEDPTTDAQTKAVLKPYVNQAITDYNLAEVAYQVFHAALATNPSASPSAAQAALQKVQADLSQTPAVTK